ncbi:NAD(P)-dependent oxidoreductase [Pseudaeromonas paramecii]|uniref:NAD(P)-dependent oxidoreductase n=1 Tax=Pseudaeromonas paramecii TaxID=2138166 RepID=A0ABP8PV80_9GAMM
MKNPSPVGMDAPGLLAGRLSQAAYAQNFADSHPPLTASQALIEADRCYDCFNAPCTQACPAGIEVPRFIQRIAQKNIRGAAEVILEANELGGICARVCPTEQLCEQACVRTAQQSKPVEIGQLQRYATDTYFADPGAPLFTRGPSSGKTVAVVGAGPAGLTVAHRLARLGHEVVLFDSKPKLGGLNEYGLATYKTTGNFAQHEIRWLLSIGGIEVRTEQMLGRDIHLAQLQQEFDAVFLGLGLAGVNSLGIPEPQVAGICEAVDFIAALRQAEDKAELPVGRQVVVIGGGMTAVDAAVQAKKLGAREVTLVYRRGEEALKASPEEMDWARHNGVAVRLWAAPLAVLSEGDQLTGMRFAVTAEQNGRLVETGETFTLAADMLLKAIGQRYLAEPAGAGLTLEGGRIAVDDQGRTSLAGVWAGGDCVAGGLDLTVDAVRLGKLAAFSIDKTLRDGAVSCTSSSLTASAASSKEACHG